MIGLLDPEKKMIGLWVLEKKNNRALGSGKKKKSGLGVKTRTPPWISNGSPLKTPVNRIVMLGAMVLGGNWKLKHFEIGPNPQKS